MRDFVETRIYLVDDDPSMRKNLRCLLQSFGYWVETFASAEEFLQADIQQTSSCLILDINLGELSVLALQKHLSENRSRIRVIFVTAYNDDYTHRMMLKTGVPILVKPFRDQKLIKLLNSVAGRPQ